MTEEIIIEGDLDGPNFGEALKLAMEIESQGYERRTAIHFAWLLFGHRQAPQPVRRDEQGRIIVEENGRELARLKLKFYEE